MTKNNDFLLQTILTNVAALVVTLIIGSHLGFPVDAERAIERLEKSEKVLGPHGTVMRDSERRRRIEEAGLDRPAPSNFTQTVFTDVRSILQWHNILFAVVFAIFLALFRPRMRSVYPIAIIALLLFFLTGYRVAIPYLLVYGGYLVLRVAYWGVTRKLQNASPRLP